MIGKDGKDCPFCDRKIWNKAVYSNHIGYVLKPLNPVTEGHLLFIPYSHFDPQNIEHLSVGAQFLGELVSGFHHESRWVEFPTEYNIILNSGKAASQSVEHMHWHLVPRREGDGLMLPWTNQKVHE